MIPLPARLREWVQTKIEKARERVKARRLERRLSRGWWMHWLLAMVEIGAAACRAVVRFSVRSSAPPPVAWANVSGWRVA